MITVSVPDVVVTASNTTPLYAGSSLTLTCTVILDPNVDNDETITISWSVPSYISRERYFVTNATGSGGVYTSNLTFTSLVHEDNGTYTCTGIVTGKNEEQVTASANHTLSVDCETTFYFCRQYTTARGLHFEIHTNKEVLLICFLQLCKVVISAYSLNLCGS